MTLDIRNLAAAAAICVLTAPGVQAQTTELASVKNDGTVGNGSSCCYLSISSDGRFVAFTSTASNLVPNDTNETQDIFVRDRIAGTTTRVSVASDGTQGNTFSRGVVAISPAGRFVAFASEASNLVQDDTNETQDIFVRDRNTGTTTRVSVASDGTEANGPSDWPAISADGRFVAFHSAASNLVSGDTNGVQDIFFHDRTTGTTVRINLASSGSQASRLSANPSINSDGRFVAFDSLSDNLLPDDTNGRKDVFVLDRNTGTLERVNLRPDGNQSVTGDSATGYLSSDGRFVAFYSRASDLVPNDTNSVADIFVRDRNTGTTTRVSVASDGTEANNGSTELSISPDGAFVAFNSSANNLVPDDTNLGGDLFIHDRNTGVTERLNLKTDGTQPIWGSSQNPHVSAGGQSVAFRSASELVPGAAGSQVYVRDRICRPVVRLTSLIAKVKALNLPNGVSNSLVSRLENARSILADANPDNDSASINMLGAFINEVEAQTGHAIPPGDATALIADANAITRCI